MDLWKYAKTKASLAGTTDWFEIVALYFSVGGRGKCPTILIPETDTQYTFVGLDVLSGNWIMQSRRDPSVLIELTKEVFASCAGKEIRDVDLPDSSREFMHKAIMNVDCITREVFVYQENKRSTTRKPINFGNSSKEFLQALSCIWGADNCEGASRKELIQTLKGEEKEWTKPELTYVE